MHTVKLNQEFRDNNDLIQNLTPENRMDYGYYLMRTNYKRVKPHSKYVQEGARPRSPNVPYSHYRQELIDNNAKNAASVFQRSPPSDSQSTTMRTNRNRNYVERYCDSVSQHLTRHSENSSQPFCFVRKDAHSNELPEDYTNSQYGAYPTWGPDKTGFRTKAHDFGEPIERFTNIDLYRRPLTNQAGKIIFDYGRPNNGYYLQRFHHDDGNVKKATWFNSSLQLNRSGSILESIEPKTTRTYADKDAVRRSLIRSKTLDWPYASEYVEKYTLKSKD